MCDFWSGAGGALVGVVGVLLGTGLGWWLSNLTRRKEWVSNAKAQEWRELISTLTECAQEIINSRSAVLEPASVRTEYLSPNQHRGKRVITDRLFIKKTIEENKIESTWQDFCEESNKLGSQEVGQKEASREEIAKNLNGQWEKLRQRLMELVKKDLGVRR